MPVSFKLTEAEAALVDSLRGETERSVWLRDIAIAAARDKQDSGIRERPGVRTTAGERQPTRKASAKGPCEHRIQPGSYCRRCDRLI